jgi:hypothetical protein
LEKPIIEQFRFPPIIRNFALKVKKMLKNKIKILAASVLFAFVMSVLSLVPNHSVRAEEDPILIEIAEYKSWRKLNDRPIKTELRIDFTGG